MTTNWGWNYGEEAQQYSSASVPRKVQPARGREVESIKEPLLILKSKPVVQSTMSSPADTSKPITSQSLKEKNQEIKNLREEIAMLQKEMRKKDAIIEKLKQEVKKKIEENHTTLNSKDDYVKELDQELQQSKKEIAKNQKTTESKIDSLLAILKGREDHIKQLEEELKQLEEELQQWKDREEKVIELPKLHLKVAHCNLTKVPYSFSKDQVTTIFDEMLRTEKRDLPEIKKPEEVGLTSHPNYCVLPSDAGAHN